MTINWKEVNQEVTDILQRLIRINTTNPPGKEIEVVRYLQKLFDREGIKSEVYEAAPGRGNIVARIPGTGVKKPLVLLSHLDVVGANPAQWSHPPFDADIADGFIWGRGALDMKGMAAMEIMSLLLCQRSGQTPSRDLIWVGAADEEVGGVYGMEWLMKQGVPGLDEAEFVINEGGEGTLREGKPVFACQNGEKGILWVKLIVRGIPGHASMPAKENAILHMAQVLQKLGRNRRPMLLCETTRGFLTDLARLQGLRLPEDVSTLDYSLQMFATRHFKTERSVQAMLYNTISPTIIQAGEKTNVLPEICEATLDCRLLPGVTPDEFLADLRNIINDSRVELAVIQASKPTESSLDTDLYRIIKETVAELEPGAVAVPYLSPGGTDSRFFRELGIAAYGFMPVIIAETELQRMHGIDERLSLENLERGTQILYEVVRRVVDLS